MEKYNDFKIGLYLDNYLNDKIEEKDFFYELECLCISHNEGILSDIKNFVSKTKAKTEDALLTLAVKVYIKLGNLFDKLKKYAGKVIKVLMWIVDKISKFREKHPILFKVIIISLLIIFFILLSASAAHAGNSKEIVSGQMKVGELQFDKSLLDILSGYMKEPAFADPIYAKSQAMIIDVKDAKIDGSWNIGEVENVIRVLQKDLSEHISKLDQSFSKDLVNNYIGDMGRSGEKLVDFNYSSNGGSFDVDIINNSGDIIRHASRSVQ